MIINKLPQKIINNILEYQGYHKERNRKYMKQIQINHPKYSNLKNIHKNIKICKGWGVECEFVKIIRSKTYKFIITVITYPFYVEWKMLKIPIYIITDGNINNEITYENNTQKYETIVTTCICHS